MLFKNKNNNIGFLKSIGFSLISAILIIIILSSLGLNIKLKDIIVLLLVAGLIISFLIPTFYVLFKRQNLNEKVLSNKYKKALNKVTNNKLEKNKANYASSLNNYFLKASKQLWDDNISSRLAGVAAISSLADDWARAENIPQRNVCIDLLTSYLRAKPKYLDPFRDLVESSDGVESISAIKETEIEDELIRVAIAKQISNHTDEDIPKTLTSWSDHTFDFTNCTFCDLDFSKSLFRAKVDFANSTFVGKTSFKNVIFEGYSTFSNCTFGNNTNFISTKFNQTVSFIGAKFGNRTLFIGAEFNGEAIFSAAEFGNKTDFINSIFNRTTDFNSAIFGDETSIISCIFKGPLFFNGAHFSNNIFFNNTQATEKTFFIQSSFGSNIDLSGANIAGIPLSVEQVYKLFKSTAVPPKTFSLIPLQPNDYINKDKKNSKDIKPETVIYPWNSSSKN